MSSRWNPQSDPFGLELAGVAGGTRLRVWVAPAAGASRLLGCRCGALRVSVAAAPERGRANRALLDFLAELFQVAPSRLRILSGETSRAKTLFVPLDPEAVRVRLADPARSATAAGRRSS